MTTNTSPGGLTTSHHETLLANAIAEIVMAAGATISRPLTGPEILLMADDTVTEVKRLKCDYDRLTEIVKAIESYADEREAYGRRGRTVHSARIASDLKAILHGEDDIPSVSPTNTTSNKG